MLFRWSIRTKLMFVVAMLILAMAILAFSGSRGAYSYRQLARSISRRAMELPPAAMLTAQVGELRFALRENQPIGDFSGTAGGRAGLAREPFAGHLAGAKQALDNYRAALKQGGTGGAFTGDKRREWETVREIEQSLEYITRLKNDHDWVLDSGQNAALEEELDRLYELAGQLPKFLQKKMRVFRDEVRGQYRTWIVLTWTSSILALLILITLVRLFYIWIFRPLETLVTGSRLVAAGNFSHRIRLSTDDEVAELADAMNAMTERFQQIRDDLDRQVTERTKEVVRSEQLASVGFLAAGVAHEINNPLASIAWCAESLESRLYEILHSEEELEGPEEDDDVRVLRTYLQRIQEEAFRCKGITEKLLDFSRMGDIQRQATNLNELVDGVIEMIKHMVMYRQKRVEFQCDEDISVVANAQEMKQVVLNLITNALDSLDKGGTVRVHLRRNGDIAELDFVDDGIGMTEDVLQHLFEPFFTRRRGGQGTGLGLSIVYRIVTDHGGRIQAASKGPGRGSQLKVTLPLSQHEEENKKNRQAA